MDIMLKKENKEESDFYSEIKTALEQSEEYVGKEIHFDLESLMAVLEALSSQKSTPPMQRSFSYG